MLPIKPYRTTDVEGSMAMRRMSMKSLGWKIAAGMVLLFGCSNAYAGPTYSHDVARIVYAHCSSCHRPGEVAPFPLLSYEDAKRRADGIAVVVEDRTMPPWKAVAGHGDFAGARVLTDAEIATVLDWVKAGCPKGDASEMPAAPVFTDGWQLGTPDLVLKMPKAFKMPASGNDIYRCFVLPIPITEEKYVSAVEFRPGNRKVVHHAIFYLDGTGAARKLEDKSDDGQIGYPSFGGPGFPPTGALGGWAPGATPIPLPEGVAKPLKPGTDLVLQLHLHLSGKPEEEASTIGIYFAKKPPTRFAMGAIMGSKNIDIPAGDKDYHVTDTFRIPAAVQLIGITPHAHYIGKKMRIWADGPGGVKTDLLWIDDWDFNWQGQYRYKNPVHLAAGTLLHMDFSYDNSSDNPRNPSNPPKRVKQGEQTTDEMAFTFLQMIPENTADAPLIMQASRDKMIGLWLKNKTMADVMKSISKEKMDKLIKFFDEDHNGVLDEEEWANAMAYLAHKYGNHE